MHEFGTDISLVRILARSVEVEASKHVDAGLLQAKGEPTCATKEVDSCDLGGG